MKRSFDVRFEKIFRINHLIWKHTKSHSTILNEIHLTYFQIEEFASKMDQIVARENGFNQRVTIDYQYFIQSAVHQKLPWNTLSYFLTDLAPTLDQTREVIKMLVVELEKWVSKSENKAKNDNSLPQIQAEETFEKHNDQQSLAGSEMSDSEGESIDVSNTPERNEQNINNSTVEENEVAKSEIQFDEIDEKLLDKIGNQFYEFIGDNEEEENSEEDEIEEACNTAKGNYTKKLEQNLDSICESKELVDVPKNKTEFKCSYCSKVFNQKCNVVRHERIHTGEKPYECETCKKCFAVLATLNNHQVLHTGEKIHQCSSCSKSFSLKSTLKQHEFLHTGEKPFQCKTCKKCFIKLSNLKDHERIHNGDKPFQCENCKRRFTSQSNWIRHKKIHTVKKPKNC